MTQERAQRLVSMKLLFSLVAIVLVALTVAGVFGLTERNARRALQREMEMRLVLEARHLALLSTDALLADYPELTLCPIVREMLQRRPDLEIAVVLDHAGSIRGHSDVRRLGERFATLSSFAPKATRTRIDDDESILISETHLAARVPARHPGGQVVGTVVVGQNRTHLDSLLTANRRQVLMLAAILAGGGVLLALIVVRRLLAPLDQLRAGLERIGRGDLETPIRLRNRTELGLLAVTIDTMAAQIKRARADTRAKEKEVVDTQREVIHTLGEVVECRSHETGNHIDRVAEGAARLATLTGLPSDECELVRMAAPMHDVGKIGIPDHILNKPGKLTPDEFAVIQTHTTIGHQILAQSQRPILKTAALIALQHHERWDGTGYPNGLRGSNIHVFGRIVAIVDVFDALTSDRCYRPAMSLAEALAIMTEGRGSQFDPDLLDLFITNLDRFLDLLTDRNRRNDPVPAVTAAAADPSRAILQEIAHVREPQPTLYE
jgi:HD-GYP domain-containing protein (c-di-GMP phosphodiesterase class II)